MPAMKSPCFLLAVLLSTNVAATAAFAPNPPTQRSSSRVAFTPFSNDPQQFASLVGQSGSALCSSSTDTDAAEASSSASSEAEPVIDYEIPEDSVVTLKPNAMKRLRELRDKQPEGGLVLRMGVRSGGCSGMSYVMDFSTEDAIEEDDEIDDYAAENIKCVVDAKSMLYLYGLELDYSDELIGGGFKFFNPNAEESCGCGSSFGV